MSIKFKNEFAANYLAHVVTEPGNQRLWFCYPGAIEDGRVDGISVEFFPDSAEAWFGSFSQGRISPNAVSFAGSTPALSKALVVSKGDGYVVDTVNPRDWFELPIRPVMGVLCLPHHAVIVAWDLVRVICIESKGIRWRTPRISWDGIKEVAQDEEHLVAKVWDAPTDTFKIARIAISNGELVGGSSPELMDLP